jgi:DNA polymerase
VKPKLTVALGGTAARSMFQKAATIASLRGKFAPLEGGGFATATIHPSYLLRIDDPDDKRAQYRAFVSDLKKCAAFVAR